MDEPHQPIAPLPRPSAHPLPQPRPRPAERPADGAPAHARPTSATGEPSHDVPGISDSPNDADGTDGTDGTDVPDAQGTPDVEAAPAVQPTGHPGVDAQLSRLADADHLAVTAHLAVYEEAHRALRDTLTALDQRPGPGQAS